MALGWEMTVCPCGLRSGDRITWRMLPLSTHGGLRGSQLVYRSDGTDFGSQDSLARFLLLSDFGLLCGPQGPP